MIHCRNLTFPVVKSEMSASVQMVNYRLISIDSILVLLIQLPMTPDFRPSEPIWSSCRFQEHFEDVLEGDEARIFLQMQHFFLHKRINVLVILTKRWIWRSRSFCECWWSKNENQQRKFSTVSNQFCDFADRIRTNVTINHFESVHFRKHQRLMMCLESIDFSHRCNLNSRL